MKLEHTGIYTADVSRLEAFYETYFEGKATRWEDENVLLSFVSFGEGARLEFMQKKKETLAPRPAGDQMGPAHVAFLATSREEVDRRAERLQKDGYTMILPPTAFGEDFYESHFLDPDGNIVEMTVGEEYL